MMITIVALYRDVLGFVETPFWVGLYSKELAIYSVSQHT